MKTLTDKDCLIYLTISKILCSEYFQGYNKAEDPHKLLSKNYLIEIQNNYPYVVQRLAEAEIENESPEKIIQIYNKQIKEIASKVEFNYFDINQVQKDIERLLAVLYKDYKFDINKIRQQVNELELEISEKIRLKDK